MSKDITAEEAIRKAREILSPTLKDDDWLVAEGRVDEAGLTPITLDYHFLIFKKDSIIASAPSFRECLKRLEAESKG